LAGQINQAVSKPLAACDGKQIPQINYHITLAFYGAADADKLACLQQAVDNIRGQSFQLTLQKLGYWPKPKVVWLAPVATPDRLAKLQSELSQAMADKCGYQPENRTFYPHLTLSRKSKRAPNITDIRPITWQARHFALVQSITRPKGAEYKVLKQWPLAD